MPLVWSTGVPGVGKSAVAETLRNRGFDAHDAVETGALVDGSDPPEPTVRFVDFADQARQVVAANGGRTLFVQLTAPRDEMLSRVSNQSRVALGKVIHPERLIQKLDTFDPSALHDNDMMIDTSIVTPEEATVEILAAL